MRCPDCSKFVSFDTDAEPEADLEISEEGQLTGEVRRILPCGECGTELKESTFSIDQNLNDLIKIEEAGLVSGICTGGEGHQWDWEKADEPEVSATTNVKDTDRHGKKITNSRYMTTMYGIEISGSVKCAVCPVHGEYSFTDETAASSFDELT